jgi:hypothetical protein
MYRHASQLALEAAGGSPHNQAHIGRIVKKERDYGGVEN